MAQMWVFSSATPFATPGTEYSGGFYRAVDRPLAGTGYGYRLLIQSTGRSVPRSAHDSVVDPGRIRTCRRGIVLFPYESGVGVQND